MKNNFDHIILKEELKQSVTFGTQYEDLLDLSETTAFNNPLFEDIKEVMNNIILKHEGLNDFHKSMLYLIFDAFNTVRHKIDPKRLKPFDNAFNNDSELLLFRKSESGLTNIIINPDDCIAFSYIPNSSAEKRIFYFLEQNGDFEKLAYDFLSH